MLFVSFACALRGVGSLADMAFMGTEYISYPTCLTSSNCKLLTVLGRCCKTACVQTAKLLGYEGRDDSVLILIAIRLLR